MDFVVHILAPMWMPQNLTNEKSTLVQLMVRCRQTIIHYLNWTRSMLPYGVICHNELMWSQKKINTVNSHMYIHIFHTGFLVHILAPMWMPQNLTNEKSTLVQLMVRCRQATIHHHLNWTRSMLPYGVRGHNELMRSQKTKSIEFPQTMVLHIQYHSWKLTHWNSSHINFF